MRNLSYICGLLILATAFLGCNVKSKEIKKIDLSDKSPEFFYNMSYYRFISHHKQLITGLHENYVRARNNYYRAYQYLESMRKYLDKRNVEKAAQLQKLMDSYEEVFLKCDTTRNFAYARAFDKIETEIRLNFGVDKIIPNYDPKAEPRKIEYEETSPSSTRDARR